MLKITSDPKYSDREVEDALIERGKINFLLAEISNLNIFWAIKSKSSTGGYILTIQYENNIISDIDLNVALLQLSYNEHKMSYSKNPKQLILFFMDIHLFSEIYQDQKSVSWYTKKS